MAQPDLPFSRIRPLVRVDDMELLRPELWQRSRSGGEATFLAMPFVDSAIRYAGLDAEIAAVVRRTAAKVRSDPRLVRLAEHLRYVFHDRTDHRFYRFTVEVPSLGDVGGMIPLLPLLAGTPRLASIHRRLRIPRRVVTDTLLDIAIWMRHRRRSVGHWGFNEIGWMLIHFNGRLYRLGRLQFATDRFHGRVHALRHRRSGRVVLLSAPGVTYRGDGRVDGTNGVKDPRGRWTSRLIRRSGTVRGHPVSATARCLRDPVSLPVREWAEVLKPGDPILDMHIPAGLPLDETAAVASCDRAPAFFRSRCPRHRFRALVCYGWLMDAAFQEMLPPVANMRRFQDHFHLYPIRGNGRHSLWTIFGKAAKNLKHAPRDTALRRNVLDFHAAGGSLLGSGGGIWKDHLGGIA